MYYRKYFSGSVDATTTTNQYYMGLDKSATGTSFQSGYIKNRSDVVGNAIVSTLKDVGYSNAYWDSTSGYVFFDKTNSRCGFYLAVQSSYMCASGGYVRSDYNYIYAEPYNTSFIMYRGRISASPSYYPFAQSGAVASDYGFYVTIKGEPTGLFGIYIGAYSNHAYESGLMVALVRGTDKRNNSALFGFNFTGEGNYAFVMQKYSTAEVKDYGQMDFAKTNALTMYNELVVLIPVFFQRGYVFLNNTYFNPGLNTGFYEIDGDTYWVYANYWITKCITEL